MDPPVLSETVSDAAPFDFLSPVTLFFFFWHINGFHCDQSAIHLLSGSRSADAHQENHTVTVLEQDVTCKNGEG